MKFNFKGNRYIILLCVISGKYHSQNKYCCHIDNNLTGLNLFALNTAIRYEGEVLEWKIIY